VFDPLNRWVALGFRNGMIEIHRWPDFKLLRAWNTGVGAVTALAVSPPGDRLLSGSVNGALHVFSTDDWREIVNLSSNNSRRWNAALVTLSFSDDGRTLVAYFMDGHVRIWRQ